MNMMDVKMGSRIKNVVKNFSGGVTRKQPIKNPAPHTAKEISDYQKSVGMGNAFFIPKPKPEADSAFE